MKVALAHYSDSQDISGVTTWLSQFAAWLRAGASSPDERPVVHLHHLGDTDWRDSALARTLVAADVAVTGERLSRLRYTETAALDAIAFLASSRPDVFLPQCLAGFHFAAQWMADRGLPWVFTMHADDPEYWALAECCGPAAAQGAWVVVSEHLAACVRARFPGVRVEAIPCGVAVPQRCASFRSDPFRVVYSGRLVETQKRASLVAATLIAACRRSQRVEAVVLGDGPARPSMEAAVAAAGLAERIRFAGRVELEQVGEELLRSQAVVLMSDYEGMPVALMEAMAAGVVPVARLIPSGIPELVLDGKTGALVGESPEAAAEALAKLADSPEDWRRQSLAARALIRERYADSVCFARWQRLLEEVAARKTIRWPIDVPGSIRLPPPHPLLRRIDNRRPGGLRYASRVTWETALRIRNRLRGGLLAAWQGTQRS